MRFAEHDWINKITFKNDTSEANDWSHEIYSEHKVINGWFVGYFTECLTVSKERFSTDWNEHKKIAYPHGIWVVDELPCFTGLLLSGNCE